MLRKEWLLGGSPCRGQAGLGLELLPTFPRAVCPGTSSTRASQPPCLSLPSTCGSASESWGPGHNHAPSPPCGPGPCHHSLQSQRRGRGAAHGGPGLRQWEKKFPPMAAPWPQATTLHHALLCLGATALNRLYGRASGCWGPATEASGVCPAAVYMMSPPPGGSSFPCLATGRVWNGGL